MNQFNINVLNRSLRIFFLEALKISLRSPAQAFSFIRTIIWQSKAAARRVKWKKKKIIIPPIIIISITNRCNLQCQGCYANTFNSSSSAELTEEKMANIVKEAHELGVSFFVIAGGEPFMRPEILDITRKFPQMIFLIFTNGILIEEQIIQQLKKQKNVVTLISLEGQQQETDSRRGQGTFNQIQRVIKKMKSEKLFFGISLTLTRQNFPILTNHQYIQKLVKSGCRFFLYLEYTPITEDTQNWALSKEQFENFSIIMKSFRKRFPALFIGVPWDENDVGGCLASGRGFVHINAKGDIEPCPFAPYSDTSLNNKSLLEALQSEFIKKIRQYPEKLTEAEGGCALWNNRDWVMSLLNNK